MSQDVEEWLMRQPEMYQAGLPDFVAERVVSRLKELPLERAKKLWIEDYRDYLKEFFDV